MGTDARERAVRHHVTYELQLPDGNRLRTRISRPVNKTAYAPGLWKTILRDQLHVSGEEFWACVNHRRLPDRGSGDHDEQPKLPASLVHQLIHQVGIPEDQVAQMDLPQAVAAITDYWSQPKES